MFFRAVYANRREASGLHGMRLSADEHDFNVPTEFATNNQGHSFMDSVLGNLGEPLRVGRDEDEENEDSDVNDSMRAETRNGMAVINSA